MGDINKPNNAKIYAKSDGVTATSADEIADTEGGASVAISVGAIQAFGQNFWPQAVALNEMVVSLNFAGVHWKQANMATLLGVAAVAGSVMDAAAATASIVKLTNSLSSITQYEYLVSYTRHSDSKTGQLWAAAAQLNSDFGMSLMKDQFITSDIGLGCFADGDGNVLWQIKEV